MPPEAAELEDADTLVEGAEVDGAEQADNDAAPVDPAQAEVERIAASLGWVPPTDLDNPARDALSAREFLARSPEIVQQLREDNRKLRSRQDRITAEMAKLSANQRRDMDARQEAALEAAVEAGDMAAVKRITAEIREGAQPQTNPIVDAFKERNAWFEVDAEATAYAATLDATYAKNGVSDPVKHMEKIEAGVRKIFPHLFETETPKPKADKPAARVPLIGGRGAAPPAKANGEVTVADLSPRQRRAAEESGVTLADYAKMVTKINKMGQRTAQQ